MSYWEEQARLLRRFSVVEKFIKPRVCYLSSYPPRECGIAQFTHDLVRASHRISPLTRYNVIAMTDPGSYYSYSRRVIFEIRQERAEDYVDAAKFINGRKDIKVVNLQHEFGLFGGKEGSYILHFARQLEKPLVTTFHSIAPASIFGKKREKIIRELGKKSSAVVTICKTGADILTKNYGVSREKLFVIPHGTPIIKKDNPDKFKKKLGIEKDKKVILSFGFLSWRKGDEYVVRALPEILRKNKDVLYLIVGEPHPRVRKEGEEYKRKLLKLAKHLGVQKAVRFHTRFLAKKELLFYLKAADIVTVMNLFPGQISSGVLAYALGAGKAIVSTPTLFAKEVLKNRGLLVRCDMQTINGLEVFKPFTKSISRAINNLFERKILKLNLEERAYRFGKRCRWRRMAKRYLRLFYWTYKKR